MPLPPSQRCSLAFAIVFFVAALQDVAAQPSPYTYRVVNLREDDPFLIVRSEPSETSREVDRLKNGTPGIRITGRIFMNGPDDWIPILVNGKNGWVRPKYLEAVWPVASLPDDSSSPATNIDPNLKSLRRTPARETAKLSDFFKEKEPAPAAERRAATTQSSDGFGWFVLMIIAVFVVAAAKKGKKKPLQPNQCPKCGHDTLETRQKFLGGSYRRCTRFWCGYNEDKIQKERERRQLIEGHRSDVLYEQQRTRERNEREAQDRERRGY